MGEVYLARDSRLQRRVALKLLPPFFTTDSERVRRFEQEAQAASALNHPNIVTIHEIGAANDLRYIVTEYIEGETLRELMTNVGLKLTQALDIAAQTAGALCEAHKAGIVHRDIKPENVMVRGDGYVKVVDFGLAKLTEPNSPDGRAEAAGAAFQSTTPGLVMGTASYMSPEQARGQKVDARTDIFSLGVMLYEMVTGRAPFDGETPSHVIVSILEKETTPLAEYAPDAPAELQRIINRALRKKRDERYQTAQELLDDLQDLKQDLESQARQGRIFTTGAGAHGESIRHGGGGARTGEPVAAVTAPPAGKTTGKHALSSERLVTSLKRHKTVALSALVLVALVAAISSYYFLANRVDSVAVLPFTYTSAESNVVADPDGESLSDGLTESVIQNLSQLPKLKVIARSSVFRYKGKETDPREVGRALNVRTVVTGAIMQRGDTLTINVELVDARDGAQLWSNRYDAKVSDLMTVQVELAGRISRQLRVRLTGEEQQRLTKQHTTNVEAHRLYHKGRYHLNKYSEDDYKSALDSFKQAIDLDPNYALAYAGMSDAYYGLSNSFLPSKEAMPKARAAALKALELDETLAEGHTSLAVVKAIYDWDWAAAEREYKRGIELNPGYANAHHVYGLFLDAMGRTDEALSVLRHAQELDPLSPSIAVTAVWPYCLAPPGKRDPERAVTELRRIVAAEPDFVPAYDLLAFSYMQLGRFDEAIAELKKAQAFGPNPGISTDLAYAYGVAGRHDEARQILAELQRRSQHEHVRAFDMVVIYAGLGEKDQAFAWRDKAFEAREEYLVIIKVFPPMDGLRDDPRFTELLRRMGFAS